MKRWLSLLLMLCLLVTLCACGGESEAKPDSGTAPDADHAHAFGDWTTVTESTCALAGSQERVCSCGHAEVRNIPAIGHALIEVPGKNATYDAEGMLAHWMCDCGALFFDAAGLSAVLDATSLKLEKLARVEVTADSIHHVIQQAGQNEMVVLPTAKVPENSVVGSVKIPVKALKAVADTGKTLVVQTERATVLFDKAAQQAIAEKAETSAHVAIEVVKISLDAMNAAQKDSVQDKAVTMVISAQVTDGKKEISHFNGGRVTVQIPFAIPEGKESSGFSVVHIADDGRIETIPSLYRDARLVVELEHFSYYAVVENREHVCQYTTSVTEPDCLKEGYTTYACEECGHIYRGDTIPAKGHSFGEWNVVKEATCTQKGEEKRTCLCGEAEMRELPVKEHEFGEWVVLVQTVQCEQDGYKERTCACGKKESVTTSCHKFGQWVVQKKPVKCAEEGYEERVCSCGELEERAIDCHKNKVLVTVVNPTCFREGYTVYRCNDCAARYNGDYVQSLGHVFDEWVVKIPAVQCVSAGVRSRHCWRCDGTFSESISMHRESDWIVDKEPSRTEDGKKHTECTDCGFVMKSKVLYGGSVGLKWSEICIVIDGDKPDEITGEAAIVGKGSCKDTELVIPQYIEDKNRNILYQVVKIGCAYINWEDGEPVGAFEGYSKLQSVVLREGVTTISYNAFKNSGLRSATLPSTLTDVQWGAFEGTKLSEIHYKGTVSQWNAINKVDGWDADTGNYTVYCTDGTVSK